MATCLAKYLFYYYNHCYKLWFSICTFKFSRLGYGQQFWRFKLVARNEYLVVWYFWGSFNGFFRCLLPHFVEHKVKPLWMIHLVHHTDHKVDTTTANRHHPLESVVRFVFTLFGVFVIGAPIGIVMLYQSMSLIATQFSHANIKLPKKVDHALSYFLVSPDMHKVHHHYVLPYTDSNYGNIFSIWDRILGTYMELDREKIVYGVDVFPDEVENGKIWSLLKQPFQKYQKPTIIPEDE